MIWAILFVGFSIMMFTPVRKNERIFALVIVALWQGTAILALLQALGLIHGNA